MVQLNQSNDLFQQMIAPLFWLLKLAYLGNKGANAQVVMAFYGWAESKRFYIFCCENQFWSFYVLHSSCRFTHIGDAKLDFCHSLESSFDLPRFPDLAFR